MNKNVYIITTKAGETVRVEGDYFEMAWEEVKNGEGLYELVITIGNFDEEPHYRIPIMDVDSFTDAP